MPTSTVRCVAERQTERDGQRAQRTDGSGRIVRLPGAYRGERVRGERVRGERVCGVCTCGIGGRCALTGR
jgi:hypothetical protein